MRTLNFDKQLIRHFADYYKLPDFVKESAAAEIASSEDNYIFAEMLADKHNKEVSKQSTSR